MRCSYCSEVYYGGEKAIYDVKKLLEDFQKHISNDEISIVFGGGEPVLNKDFKYLLDYSLNNFNIKSLLSFTIYPSNNLFCKFLPTSMTWFYGVSIIFRCDKNFS